MNWFSNFLRNYANFRGRASRKEFWCFVLIWIVASLCVALCAQFVLLLVFNTVGISLYVVYGIWLFGIVPYCAVAVRRLHDTGRSAWWGGGYLLLSLAVHVVDFFIGLPTAEKGATWIQLAGVQLMVLYLLFLIILFCLPGDKGPNKYGPDPKADRE